MAETRTDRATALSGRSRLLAAVLAVGLMGLLATAAVVGPDPRGLGTHQRLGLPPCTFRMLFGRPCPACGMTTAWACLMQGQLIGALRANVGGTLLGVLALIGTPWVLVSTIRGRWLGSGPNRAAAAWVTLAIVLVMLVDWGLRLGAG